MVIKSVDEKEQFMNEFRSYGDLKVTLTSAYSLRYPDWGSGARMNGAFYHPEPQGEFRPLGSVVIGNHAPINGMRASMLVADGGNKAVAAPIDYVWIWNDSGSGADWDGSVRRPVPPLGYVAMGDVAQTGHGKPSVNDVWCLRADLVAAGQFAGGCAWQDAGSGGTHDIAAWPVILKDPSADPTKAVFEPDTFISTTNYSTPPNAGLARVILVPLEANVVNTPEVAPNLESRQPPPATTQPVCDRQVTLPFTCLFDRTDRPSLDKIANPFCTIERWTYWSLVLFNNNTTSLPQTQSKSTMVGITETESKSFSHSVGVKVGWEGGVGVKWKVELNYQFTLTTSTSMAVMRSDTVQRSLTSPPGHAAALWAQSWRFEVIRSDGSRIAPGLAFETNSFVHDQFPPPANETSMAVVS